MKLSLIRNVWLDFEMSRNWFAKDTIQVIDILDVVLRSPMKSKTLLIKYRLGNMLFGVKLVVFCCSWFRVSVGMIFSLLTIIESSVTKTDNWFGVMKCLYFFKFTLVNEYGGVVDKICLYTLLLFLFMFSLLILMILFLTLLIGDTVDITHYVNLNSSKVTARNSVCCLLRLYMYVYDCLCNDISFMMFKIM